MTASRAALLAAAALACLPTATAAQDDSSLPPGLVRNGGTITMRPVGGEGEETESGSELRASSVHTLNPADHDLFTKAFEAANRGDYLAAKALADQGRDPVARKIVIWRYLLAPTGGASFDEIDSFIRANPDWPLRNVLYQRAEHAMAATMEPSSVIAWFGVRPPATAIGQVRLGEALIATGHRSEGREMIRKAWIEGDFEVAEELDVTQHHGDILSGEADKKRLERLIWRGDFTAARRELSRVDSDAQRVAEVRMALKTNPKSGEKLLESLPDALREEPGLLFDRARNQRSHGDKTAVPEVLVKAPVRELAKLDQGRWWAQTALAARESIEAHDYKLAYRLVSETGFHDGDEYAEAQFMAGWLALRFLKEPETALDHFKKLAAAVSRPISAARARYWMGRAYEAGEHLKSASREYKLATEYPETFYGQLALARLDPDAKLRLTSTPADPDAVRSAYEKDEQTRAVRILGDLGSERFLRIFAVHEVELHPEAGRVAALSADLVRMGFRDIAVRAAKTASYSGVDLPAYTHPVIALPAYRGPGEAPEQALILALIRQETEFSGTAVSHAGARGLMQVMPASGKHLASLSGLPWKPGSLTGDETYNVELGMTEIATHLQSWGGSYVLAAAGYNAGDTNVQRWINNYGDPRSSADPVDWIETIPFSETRNYVQRVLENVEVYRNRLAGKSEPLRILADLYRPAAPAAQTQLPAPASAADSAAPTPRPQAR